jgi:hypothetical protein
MLDDAQHVRIRLLQELVQPMDGLDVSVAAHLAKDGRCLDGFVPDWIQFAEQRGAFDFSHRSVGSNALPSGAGFILENTF